ncbi:histidine kinase [Striga asiatica]|uniref:Histidine kinase n=1 Tax=Striga asiatica TaxID=4170 RepID=A0A5A7RI08_STRAF|nr:histidine kinase [Striga asiatica]
MMSSANFSSNHNIGDLGVKALMMEQNLVRSTLHHGKYTTFGLATQEEPNALNTRHETEKSIRPAILRTPNSGADASISDQDKSPLGDSRLCSISSICPAPICRQFWKAGNYDDNHNSKATCQNGTGRLRVHPKFLHSNATSHKWVFGAMAEMIDNSVDEIQNGATSVIVDKISNPKDGTPALLIQDDGGGMDPEAMRRCLSFGFSDKQSQYAIGKYGNGFKTSSMRLGADVVVFSRCKRDSNFCLMLRHYTGLSATVDYLFDTDSGTWKALHDDQRLKQNLSILLQWSPVATEAELLKLDISISGNFKNTRKSEQHLANRLHCSLRAYLSILYLRIPENFRILLRGLDVEYHNIAGDLKFPEFILYRPHNVEGSVITTIGFLKEAPAVNIHGFNVYHKNRLILVTAFTSFITLWLFLPFWHVVSYSHSRGKGVVGVLEANFIEPTHNKQDFEKTPVYQKLEARLKAMTLEYWDYHCGLVGYYQARKSRGLKMPQDTSNSGPGQGIYQPVVLGQDSGASGRTASFVAAKNSPHEVASGSSHHMAPNSERHSSPIAQDNTQGKKQKTLKKTFKRKHRGHDDAAELVSVERRGLEYSGGDKQLPVDPEKQSENQDGASLIRENKRLRSLCQEYEKTDEELDLKIKSLEDEVREAERECTRMLLESRLLEKIKESRKLLLV